MLASINPLGERSRSSRWWVTVTAYLIGSTAGGALLGGLLGLAGSVLRHTVEPGTVPTAVVVGVAAAAGLAFEVRTGGVGIPTIRRQVDEDWLARYRGWVYGVGFGFQLGLGVVTVVTTATVYVAFVLAFLSGSVSGGVVVGLTFGAARALPVLALARVREPRRLRSVMRTVQRWASVSRSAAIGALLLVTLAAAQGAAWAS